MAPRTRSATNTPLTPTLRGSILLVNGHWSLNNNANRTTATARRPAHDFLRSHIRKRQHGTAAQRPRSIPRSRSRAQSRHRSSRVASREHDHNLHAMQAELNMLQAQLQALLSQRHHPVNRLQDQFQFQFHDPIPRPPTPIVNIHLEPVVQLPTPPSSPPLSTVSLVLRPRPPQQQHQQQRLRLLVSPPPQTPLPQRLHLSVSPPPHSSSSSSSPSPPPLRVRFRLPSREPEFEDWRPWDAPPLDDMDPPPVYTECPNTAEGERTCSARVLRYAFLGNAPVGGPPQQ